MGVFDEKLRNSFIKLDSLAFTSNTHRLHGDRMQFILSFENISHLLIYFYGHLHPECILRICKCDSPTGELIYLVGCLESCTFLCPEISYLLHV